MTDNHCNVRGINTITLIIFVVLGVLLVYGLSIPVVWSFAQGDAARAATIGDSFGAVNAFFSGVAMILVVVTILLQRADLKHSHLDPEQA